MQPTLRRMGPPKYAPHPNHPIHIHPARPFYRFMATGLGASMWFFVRLRCGLRTRARGRERELLTRLVDVPREAGRPRAAGLEAPVGPLSNARRGRGTVGDMAMKWRRRQEERTKYIRAGMLDRHQGH
ncbi:hypothetical protein ACJQWK_09157 [Exserohilum turcicum]